MPRRGRREAAAVVAALVRRHALCQVEGEDLAEYLRYICPTVNTSPRTGCSGERHWPGKQSGGRTDGSCGEGHLDWLYLSGSRVDHTADPGAQEKGERACRASARDAPDISRLNTGSVSPCGLALRAAAGERSRAAAEVAQPQAVPPRLQRRLGSCW